MKNLVKEYEKKIEMLKKQSATDKQLNNFIEKMAWDEKLTNKEYTMLSNKIIDLRRI